jgi:hypothetical protein
MNGVQDAAEPLEPASGVGDYFVLESEAGSWCISTAMARAVDAELATSPVPEWITFVDLAGSRIRLRTRRIESLTQCTAEQRSSRRAFNHQLNLERKAERPWDEDD